VFMLNIGSRLRKINAYLSADHKRFFTRGFIGLLIWFLLSDLFFIHDFLVSSLAVNAAGVIEFFSEVAPTQLTNSFAHQNYCSWDLKDSRAWIRIGSNCDGWELYYLYSLFIFIFPGIRLERKFFFAVIGTLTLYFFNVLRIAGLFFLEHSYPIWFGIFHKVIFQVLAYLIMFGLWIIYLTGRK